MTGAYPPIPGVTVIGFTGHARHGKDEATRLIHCADPAGTERFAFSDALSADCRVNAGMTRRDPRLLQEHGTRRRHEDSETWIRALYWRIDEVRPRVALITGVRNANEETFIRGLGGLLVRVVRVEADGAPFVADDRPRGHEAEAEIDGLRVDYVIRNVSGDLPAFGAAALSTYRTALARLRADGRLA